MFEFSWYLISFLLALTVLIVFHEFGHFIVARFFGVKVLRFSIGFGPALFKRVTRSGMEFVVALIPLGGYVKMADETIEPLAEADLPYSFRKQTVWARIAIVAAGPFFNFFLAIFAFAVMFWIGITSLKPIIGEIVPHSIMAQAGVKAGDEIVTVNGVLVHGWSEVLPLLVRYRGESVTLGVKTPPDFSLTNRLLHLEHWQANLLTGAPFQSLGITPFFPVIPAIIGKVLPNGPAEKAGFLAGDQILAVNSKPVKSWQELLQIYQTLPAHTASISLTIKRENVVRIIHLRPAWHLENGQWLPRIGVESKPVAMPKKYLNTRHFGFLKGLWRGAERTWQILGLTLILLGKMIVGKLSLASLSGPIGIAQGAGFTASLGLSYYLDFLATMSISLGIINLLPIPLLDGGHLFFYLIEIFSGRPVSIEIQAFAMKVGLCLLLVLMMLGVINDLHRIFS